MQAPADLTVLSAKEMEALEQMRELFKDATYPDQQDPTSWFQLNDWTFLRYLRARKYNVSKAEKMLRDTLEFRTKWTPHLIQRTDQDVTAGLNQLVWRLLGLSKDGSPVQLVFAKLFDASIATSDDAFIRSIVYESECVVREMQKQQWKSDKTDVIFEMEGYSLLKQASPSTMRLLKLMLEISTSDDEWHRIIDLVETNQSSLSSLQKMLGVSFIYNAPMIFRGVWAIIKPWLDEATVSRVVFVNDTSKILERVDKSLLTVQHGGIRTKEYPVLYFEEQSTLAAE